MILGNQEMQETRMAAHASARAVPTRYQDPLVKESARNALFRKAYRLPPPREEHIARFRDTLFDGDPLADEVVRMFAELPRGEGYRLLARAVDEGIASIPEAPAPLVALFAELDARPEWVDNDQLELAARTADRVGMSGERVLSCICLTGGYRSSAANKPIAFTGALESMAYRRLAETSKFVFDLYESRTVARGSAGFRGAVMVRLMHAMVRVRLTDDPRWRMEAWGLPVNQADLLATNLLFSSVFVIGLRTLGHLITRREADALVHFWRYVGYLMGVRLDLLPHDFKEACALVYLSAATQPGGDEDSRKLAAALLAVPVEPDRPRPLVYIDAQWRAGFSRLVLGDDAGDELGLPNNAWKWLVLGSTAWNFATELVRLLLPGGNALFTRIRRARVRRNVERALDGKPPAYRPYPPRSESR
ncbi:oxygenase MpaB family protein [Polyangium mundeleinium]|uniref:Oxygenase MpaB family protein n=1 Tax=Polyangium mundeleinium TaxID=2995306 RepID=A0ABT5EZK0_9BACT|nr:oxygenase MpaB family protein [Polyangium mundeleinium]MDC0746598.1 oxygenase MpaB family protein [Polyangium mundeleinium]